MHRRDEADEQCLVRRILMERPTEPLPDGFAQRLSARLDRSSPGAWLVTIDWRAWSIRLMPAAVALLGFAFAGSDQGRNRTDISSEIVEWGMHESGVAVLNLLDDSVERAGDK